MSLNWYGPRGASDPEPNQFRVGPHTDFGTLTVLDREPGLGGLQVKDEAGDWIDAPHVEASLVINTGDLIRRWTNDRWCSNQHRVLPPPAEEPTEELISLVFFHEPDDDALIEALPTCVDQRAPDPPRTRDRPRLPGCQDGGPGGRMRVMAFPDRPDDTFVHRGDTPALDSRNVHHAETEHSCEPNCIRP